MFYFCLRLGVKYLPDEEEEEEEDWVEFDTRHITLLLRTSSRSQAKFREERRGGGREGKGGRKDALLGEIPDDEGS